MLGLKAGLLSLFFFFFFRSQPTTTTKKTNKSREELKSFLRFLEERVFAEEWGGKRESAGREREKRLFFLDFFPERERDETRSMVFL
jgi:hypothetical protein